MGGEHTTHHTHRSAANPIRAWLKLVRIEHALMSAIGVAIGILLVPPAYQAVGGLPPSGELYPLLSAPQWFLALAVPFFINVAAFALNDYWDIEADKKNGRKDRPLVNGALAPNIAVITAAIGYIVGISAGWLLNPACGIIASLFALASVAYNRWLKDMPLAGNLYIAIAMAIAFPFGAAAGRVPLESMPGPIVWLTAGAFFAGLCREILKSVQDMEGDRAARGSKHLPLVIGERNARRLASFSATLYCASLVGLASQTMSWSVLGLAILAISGIVYFIISADLLKPKLGADELERMRKASLYALMLALTSVVLTIFM